MTKREIGMAVKLLQGDNLLNLVNCKPNVSN